jgi:hypothetical protein
MDMTIGLAKRGERFLWHRSAASLARLVATSARRL